MIGGNVESSLAGGLLPAYRTPGMSPGDYIDVVLAEIDRLLEQTGGNQLKAINLGFARMRDSGLITEADLKRMEKVAVIIAGVGESKTTSEEAAARLDKLYLEALADPQASSTGATMIGVMYSQRSKQAGEAAGLMGMIVGGLITGGPGGALVGGLVGYVVGSRCAKD
jgi:hypothetical protein